MHVNASYFVSSIHMLLFGGQRDRGGKLTRHGFALPPTLTYNAGIAQSLVQTRSGSCRPTASTYPLSGRPRPLPSTTLDAARIQSPFSSPAHPLQTTKNDGLSH